MAYLIEGKFPSYFAGKPIPVKEVEDKKPLEQENSAQKDQPDASQKKSDIDLSQIQRKGQFLPMGRPGKIFVMAAADMLKNNVVDASGRGANTILLLNVLDYLNDREDIAVMRGKVQQFNPLDDTQPGIKTFVKTFNIVGLPVLVILFGLGVWFRRHSRKKYIQMMFGK